MSRDLSRAVPPAEHQTAALYGHGAGGAVLCAIADQLRAHAPAGDALARLGGDELVLVLSGADSR